MSPSLIMILPLSALKGDKEMEAVSFRFLEKSEFELYGERLFALLHGNMSEIAPGGKSYDEEKAEWLKVYGGAFRGREQRKIVLVVSETGETEGFFGYLAAGELFLMEEIQFSPKIQGECGIFRRLYRLVLGELPCGIKYVEAYAHKNNARSLGILSRLGLKTVGENDSGDCYHLRGELSDLLRWSRCI